MSERKVEIEEISVERRAALRAIGKYAKFTVGTSVVVLSSAEAVKAHHRSWHGGGNGGGHGGGGGWGGGGGGRGGGRG